MATATVVRPSQALRTRRDQQPRPSLPAKRASMADSAEPASKRRKMDEPYVRTKDYILRKFAGKPVSMIVHLHPNYFRFEGQEGSFTYDSPMASFLKSLRNQELPADMMEFLLNNVPFYDGCLIVEVHNHRSANGKNKGKHDSATGDQVKFSMHNYNNYVTPSGLTPFPKKAKENELPDNAEAGASKQEKGSDHKDKDDGPGISTLVMFPTPLSQHREMMILANTPASELKSKRKSTDGSTTPVPPTPLAAASRTAGQENKMALEEQDYYQFQADVLLATEPLLYLEPVKNPQEAQRVLDMLKHPLHSNPPPSPKTRKRTTAELAADDAQAAEAERRMLIMDERKATAPGAADSAGNSQALGLNRFKTLQMVREKLDEAERQKKEEQEQAQAQRKQEEAAASAAQAQKQAQAEHQRKLMNQRQHVARQQHERRQQQIQAQQAALMVQGHAHPQQNGMMNQQQQNNFPTSVAQSSPVVRQQTPMMNNSSPMVAQNGFPMAATSSQQAGSPPRPTSAAMPNPNVAMARQASQQHNSRNATPQMAQGTPNMAAMPNRQMNQTPRIPHGSPAPGTPATANMNMSMPMQTPGQTAITPEQFAMLQARQQQIANQVGAMNNAGSPGQNQANMTPEQIQHIHQQQQQQHRQRQQQMMMAQAQAAAQNSNNPSTQRAMQQRAYLLQQQQAQQAMQQRMLQAQQQQNNAAQAAGSPHPGSMHATPQMGHAHPQQGQQGGGGGDMNQGQQLTPQQQQQRQQQHAAQLRQAQQHVQSLLQQYQSVHAIPQQVFSGLPPFVQMYIYQQKQRQQNSARARQMAMQAQQAQNSGQAVAGTGTAPDPEYMQTLRQHQTMLAQQQQQQQGGQMNGMSMTHNMNFGNMGNQQFGGGGGQGDHLSQQFQAMQAALNRGQQGGGGMGQ